MSGTPGTYLPNADEIQKANARRVGWQAPDPTPMWQNSAAATLPVYDRLLALEARCAALEQQVADLTARLERCERQLAPRNGQRE